MLKLMMITNNCDIAKYVVSAGVNRIFIDLEINGKIERQGHLDTVISNHTFNDIEKIRFSLPDTEILVRLNPLYEGTKEEVDNAISAGANLLMLPMINYKEELEQFSELVSNRVGIVPLIETPQAMVRLKGIVKVNGVQEVYIGLNDLHLGLGLDFMFEILASGLVDHMAQICKEENLPFGFGGLAKMEDGLLPGQLVLAEHMRLKSSSVILSRAFHLKAKNLIDLKSKVNLEKEICKIRSEEKRLLLRNANEIVNDQKKTNEIIQHIKKNKCRNLDNFLFSVTKNRS